MGLYSISWPLTQAGLQDITAQVSHTHTHSYIHSVILTHPQPPTYTFMYTLIFLMSMDHNVHWF